MSQSVHNNMEVQVEDNMEQGQGSGDQASCQEPQHSDTPLLPSELASNLGNPSYWPTFSCWIDEVDSPGTCWNPS